jgi:hypothetical protein
MRSTTIPAQVTTVEDKVAGELTVKQLTLLIIPLVGSGAIFSLLPPFSESSPYKVTIIVCLFTLCGTLAVRIKGKILLEWLLVITRYALRPRYYFFNKNDSYLRDISQPQNKKSSKSIKAVKPQPAANQKLKLSTADLVQIEKLVSNPKANLQIKTSKKGALSVHFTEI